jgi:hypothetical protein
VSPMTQDARSSKPDIPVQATDRSLISLSRFLDLLSALAFFCGRRVFAIVYRRALAVCRHCHCWRANRPAQTIALSAQRCLWANRRSRFPLGQRLASFLETVTSASCSFLRARTILRVGKGSAIGDTPAYCRPAARKPR